MRRQCRNHVGQGQDDLATGVVDIQRNPVRRISGIKWHIGRPGLENGQCGDQQISRPPDIQPDTGAGRCTHIAQGMGDFVGRLVQVGVGQRLPFEMQGDGVGRALHLLFKLFVDAALGKIGGGGVPPGCE